MPELKTIEQFGESVKKKYPQYQDIDNAELGRKIIEKYPVYQNRISAEKEEGFVKGLAKDIAQPFLKVGSTVSGAIEGIGTLGGAGLSKLFGTDESAQRQISQAKKTVEEGGVVGRMSGVKPVGADIDPNDSIAQKTLQFGKEVAGTGAEIGSYAAPGAAFKLAKGVPLSQKALQFGKVGAAESGLFSGGRELAKPESTLGSVAKETAIGAAIGAPTAAALPVAGAALSRGGRGLAQGFKKVTKPVVSTARKQLPKSVEFGVSQASGLSPESVKRVVNNPNRFSPDKLASLNRETLTERVAKKVTQKLEDLSGLGKEYNVIRQIQKPLPLEFTDNGIHKVLADTLSEFGVKITDGKLVRSKLSRAMKPGDLREMQEFVDLFGKEIIESGDEFLNLRQQLDLYADWAMDKAGVSAKFARDLRKKYDKLGKATYEGLEALDNQYSPAVQELRAVTKEIGDPRKGLKDNAPSKLANIANPTNTKRLEKLRRVIPDIEDDVLDLKVIEDLERARGQKVGTYPRAVLTGGAVLSGNFPLAIASWLLTTPDNILILLRRFGQLKQKTPAIQKIVDKIQGGKELTVIERKVVKEAVEEAQDPTTQLGKEVQETIKVPVKNSTPETKQAPL